MNLGFLALVFGSGLACQSADPGDSNGASAGASQAGSSSVNGGAASDAHSAGGAGETAQTGDAGRGGLAGGSFVSAGSGGNSAGSGGTATGGNANGGSGNGGRANAVSGSGGKAAGDGGSAAAEPGVLGVIAVGYGGLRIVTRDLGLTWENESHWSTSGGDDHDLLRTIAYGNGFWLSGGWRLTTSTDGVVWIDRGDAVKVISAISCPVTDGLAFGAGRFLVACGSTLAASSNGLDWERAAKTPDVGTHPYLMFDAAKKQFACSGDNGHSFVSSDGVTWTEVPILTAHLCESGLLPKSQCPSFYLQGVFLSTEWGGLIRRSTNGSTFTSTYHDQFKNNLFTEYSFAVGRVAP